LFTEGLDKQSSAAVRPVEVGHDGRAVVVHLGVEVNRVESREGQAILAHKLADREARRVLLACASRRSGGVEELSLVDVFRPPFGGFLLSETGEKASGFVVADDIGGAHVVEPIVVSCSMVEPSINFLIDIKVPDLLAHLGCHFDDLSDGQVLGPEPLVEA
jgi:hypothetical protein